PPRHPAPPPRPAPAPSADRRISSCPSTAPLRPTDEAPATTSKALHRSCDVGAPGEWVRSIDDVARALRDLTARRRQTANHRRDLSDDAPVRTARDRLGMRVAPVIDAGRKGVPMKRYLGIALALLVVSSVASTTWKMIKRPARKKRPRRRTKPKMPNASYLTLVPRPSPGPTLDRD